MLGGAGGNAKLLYGSLVIRGDAIAAVATAA
jgi:hypothetical protein